MAKAELARSGLNVLIPHCHRDFTTQNLLVMEWADGFKARLASHGGGATRTQACTQARMRVAETRFAPQPRPLCALDLLSSILSSDGDFHACSGH